MMIPSTQVPVKITSNGVFMTLRSIIIEGKLNVVTAIIKARIVPSCAPLPSRASATGIVPKISAYIGVPAITPKITPKGFLPPKIVSTHAAGIQLWMKAPIPTPSRI